MATCSGKASNQHCGGLIYKCTKCGLAGCRNTRNGHKCSNDITKDSGGTCRNCGGQLKTL
jgi:hypothetical protein